VQDSELCQSDSSAKVVAAPIHRSVSMRNLKVAATLKEGKACALLLQKENVC